MPRPDEIMTKVGEGIELLHQGERAAASARSSRGTFERSKTTATAGCSSTDSTTWPHGSPLPYRVRREQPIRRSARPGP